MCVSACLCVCVTGGNIHLKSGKGTPLECAKRNGFHETVCVCVCTCVRLHVCVCVCHIDFCYLRVCLFVSLCVCARTY